MTEYADRDAQALGEHYTRHISAMTEEDLSSKSDIAAELAWRDMQIYNLSCTVYYRDGQIDKLEKQRGNREKRIAELQRMVTSDMHLTDRIVGLRDEKQAQERFIEDVKDALSALQRQLDPE